MILFYQSLLVITVGETVFSSNKNDFSHFFHACPVLELHV